MVLNMPNASSSQIFDRVLNMPQALNMSGFWICHESIYATVTYDSEYPWTCLNNHTFKYDDTSFICYFFALPNTEDQLFIDSKAQVQCTRYNKWK